MQTPLRRLADTLIEGGVDRFIAARRPAKSWRLIALDLRDTTGGQIDVTPETLRKWATDSRSQDRVLSVPTPGTAA